MLDSRITCRAGLECYKDVFKCFLQSGAEPLQSWIQVSLTEMVTNLVQVLLVVWSFVKLGSRVTTGLNYYKARFKCSF